MAKRRKIGIFTVYSENWTGGLYYLLNIIQSLMALPVEEQPRVVVFYSHPEAITRIEETKYPYLDFLPINKKPSLMGRVYARLLKMFVNKPYDPQYTPSTVDFLFPLGSDYYNHKGSLKRLRKIYWIPDFQHKGLPHFFSREEIDERDRNFSAIAGLEEKLVLSSESAKSDFLRFYPDNRSVVNVLPFVSILPDLTGVDLAAVQSRYDIHGPYFMSPNQFWVHKNHMTLLKAIDLLKREGHAFTVVFTGREYDHRSPDYTESLKNYVREKELASHVRFLGFIDRREQLLLMKHALAVIQPSLFEGWSTVVEDAKALQQAVIVSDLAVHREQCGQNAWYFEPTDAQELARHMKKYLQGAPGSQSTVEYTIRIREFAKKIVEL